MTDKGGSYEGGCTCGAVRYRMETPTYWTTRIITDDYA